MNIWAWGMYVTASAQKKSKEEGDLWVQGYTKKEKKWEVDVMKTNEVLAKEGFENT